MALQTYNPDKTITAQYDSAAVIGLGATGYSVVRYLRAQGLQVLVMDNNVKPALGSKLAEQYPEVQLVTGPFEYTALADHALIVASPGVPLADPVLRQAKKNGAHIVGDIELFVQHNSQPLIAITGSNGKSTVTTLVGQMCESGGLKPWVAGNIGRPALDAYNDKIDYQVAVLELSSFQLETITNMPAQAAAILNVTADHMDRYSSMGDYLLAKARILRGAKCAVIARHDEQLQQITRINNVLTFALDEPVNDTQYGIKATSSRRWLMKGEQRLIKLNDIPLVGLHNISNVLAAYALTDFLQLPLSALADAVKSFKGLEHRMQTVLKHNTVTWVNDSKATNVGATTSALQSLESDIVWIAGGQGKGADFNELKAAISKNVKQLIVFGEDAQSLEQALNGMLAIDRVETMQQAVELAALKATKKSVVLFSPACASFDMYQNFEQRGNDFSKRALSLSAGGGE